MMIIDELKGFDRERVRVYIEALRSGEYEQGFDHLREGSCFCALGVAGDVAIRGGAAAKWDGDEVLLDDEFDQNDEYLSASSILLTEAIKSWYGADLNEVSLDRNIPERCISALNDTCQYGFDEIANRLEARFFPDPTY